MSRPGAQAISKLSLRSPEDNGRGDPPSLLTTQTRLVPPSLEPNAICLPSGDQTPPTLNDLKNVSCREGPPVTGMTYKLANGSRPALKTIHFPSGETLGRSTTTVPCVNCVISGSPRLFKSPRRTMARFE